MTRVLVILIGLILVSQGVSAWGPLMHEYLCEEAVIKVWGADTAKNCLIDADLLFQKRFCETLEDEYYDGCVNLSEVVNPANMPCTVFNDCDQHKDYSKCPVKVDKDARYMCGNLSYAPALDYAEKWFDKAANATDVCNRVYDFCIASSYLADSYVPENQLAYKSVNKCEGELEKKVDDSIKNKNLNIYVRIMCRYEYLEELTGMNRTTKYSQSFIITNKTPELIISSLDEHGKIIAGLPYSATTTSSSTSSSSSTTTILKTTTITLTTTYLKTSESDGKTNIWLLLAVIIILVAAAAHFMREKVEKAGKRLLHHPKREKPTKLEKAAQGKTKESSPR